MHRPALAILTSLALASPTLAQDAPEPQPDIFLFAYDASASDDALSNGINTTNRPTLYDNQPFFTSGGDTFVYSRGDGTQTDVWEYDIASATHAQITDTPESEYSPTPSPDNRTVSVVFERNRSIWEIDRADPDNPVWLLEAAGVDEPVGYFARNHASGDVLFWSRYGFNVALTHASEPAYHFVSGHAVPASPHLIPGTGEFSFVHRQTNEEVWIKALDPETRAVRPLTPIAGTNANYTWAPDGSILQIEGTQVHRWREGGKGWEVISDLADHGLASAYRIAVSPDGTRVAVVGIGE
ncbi:hypothetical protein [Aurantiacibacter sp. D1-12]|uniref:hypothetical protein n=1 Tax=Aurantiacibacter sp. D1-12 TaxID=2993658 RepID=UPI00237C83BA|nr:hypothetical protein [Aurantiacibacter sp. D1-12]MDE1468542.1 hypothetical protein [Aurantiacibacter sp. D1-12]